MGVVPRVGRRFGSRRRARAALLHAEETRARVPRGQPAEQILRCPLRGEVNATYGSPRSNVQRRGDGKKLYRVLLFLLRQQLVTHTVIVIWTHTVV